MIELVKKEQIKELIAEAEQNMSKSKELLGKETYQKRVKPVFEGYLTALYTVLDMMEEEDNKEKKLNEK